MFTILGEPRPGNEFVISTKPSNMAQAYFIALAGDNVYVTRRLADLTGNAALLDAVQVLANWHGAHRTDVFLLTLGELRAKVLAWK